MTRDDELRFNEIADHLEDVCFHVSVRDDCGVPLVFAVGLRNVHSLDFRRRNGELVIEYWRGYPDDDFVSEQVVESFEQAIPLMVDWLSRDAAQQ